MSVSTSQHPKDFVHEILGPPPPKGLLDRLGDGIAGAFNTDRWRNLFHFRPNGVRNPATLARRLQLAVHTLPRLPSRRKLRAENDARIERFVSKLDHIRFAFRKTPCLLVTSAVRGEGKTALAAQFAARSGNDGISTLLVDADLRNSALSSLLNAPDGLGLQDWLNGNADLDDAITPVCDGLFSLLRAGVFPTDVIGLLPDAKIKTLIEQLRKKYDLILIDAPPVGDSTFALTLCEHVDLAVLSVLYGESRYPLVAQAKRRLAVRRRSASS